MASIVIMPKQGLLMEEGVIVNWIVKEGGKATEGEPLFEMETDKLTITMDSTATGNSPTQPLPPALPSPPSILHSSFSILNSL